MSVSGFPLFMHFSFTAVCGGVSFLPGLVGQVTFPPSYRPDDLLLVGPMIAVSI